jgi:GT2 family glycosyltransferase
VKPIILNYNNLPDTKACIKSVLEADGQTSVFLIDNASEPKCVEGIKGLYEKRENIELRLNSVNLGFTKAHNDVLKELIEKEAYFFFFAQQRYGNRLRFIGCDRRKS